MSWVNSLRARGSCVSLISLGRATRQARERERDALEAEDVAAVLLAEVELDPGAVEVERDGVGPAHALERALELVEEDLAVAVRVEDAEGNLQGMSSKRISRESWSRRSRRGRKERTHVVLGGRLLEELLEGDEVVPVDAPSVFSVGDLEEDAVLLAADLGEVGFGRDGRHKVGLGEVAASGRRHQSRSRRCRHLAIRHGRRHGLVPHCLARSRSRGREGNAPLAADRVAGRIAVERLLPLVDLARGRVLGLDAQAGRGDGLRGRVAREGRSCREERGASARVLLARCRAAAAVRRRSGLTAQVERVEVSTRGMAQSEPPARAGRRGRAREGLRVRESSPGSSARASTLGPPVHGLVWGDARAEGVDGSGAVWAEVRRREEGRTVEHGGWVGRGWDLRCSLCR